MSAARDAVERLKAVTRGDFDLCARNFDKLRDHVVLALEALLAEREKPEPAPAKVEAGDVVRFPCGCEGPISAFISPSVHPFDAPGVVEKCVEAVVRDREGLAPEAAFNLSDWPGTETAVRRALSHIRENFEVRAK